MFSSTLCRATRAHSPIPTAFCITGLTSPASITASSRPLTSRSHRRRYSSSKPSSPPDDSIKVTAQQQDPTSATSRTRSESEKRPVTRLSKRKAKYPAVEATATVKGRKDETLMNLPCVPSTHHLHPADVAISAFFSLHRPISISNAVPSTSTPISFNTIFYPHQRSSSKPTHQPSDVINTLASVVQNLEARAQPTQQQQEQEVEEEIDLQATVAQASISNAGMNSKSLNSSTTANNNSPLQFPAHLLSGKFKPFNPPPPPSPMGTSVTTTRREEKARSTTKQKSYSMGVTVHETTTPDGRVTYTAMITTPVLISPHATTNNNNLAPTTANRPTQFLSRMMLRQQRWQEHVDNLMEKRGLGARERARVWAISVKRQRKLKMKKHKYKKLMKRTRNLRRRLDKL